MLRPLTMRLATLLTCALLVATGERPAPAARASSRFLSGKGRVVPAARRWTQEDARRALDETLRAIDAGGPRGVALLIRSLRKQTILAPSLVKLGRGERPGGARVDLFGDEAGLRAHYLALGELVADHHARRRPGRIHTADVILGASPFGEGDGTIHEVRFATGHMARIFPFTAGNAQARYPYLFGFLDKDGITTPIVLLGREPWSAATRFAPRLLQALLTVMKLSSHDVTMHDLFNFTWTPPGWWLTSQGARWGTAGKKVHFTGIELNSFLGHFSAMQDLFARRPRVRRALLRQARAFEGEVDRLHDRIVKDLTEAGQARELAAATAGSLRDYFLEVYFNKNLFFVLSAEDDPELRQICERHPVLQRNRRMQAEVWRRYRAGGAPVGARDFPALLEEYRRGVNLAPR